MKYGHWTMKNGQEEQLASGCILEKKDILHSYVKKLNQYVESGELRAAKVAMKHPDYDPFPEKDCVMCIFTTGSKEHKDNTKAFIKEKFRIEPAAWKSEGANKKRLVIRRMAKSFKLILQR